MTYEVLLLVNILSLRLGYVAAHMRRQIDTKTSDVAYRTRSLLTCLSLAPGHICNVSFAAKTRADVDVMLSSWTKSYKSYCSVEFLALYKEKSIILLYMPIYLLHLL